MNWLFPKKEKRQIKKIKNYVAGYLKNMTIKPAMESTDNNSWVAIKLGNDLITLGKSMEAIGFIRHEFDELKCSKVSEKDIQRLKDVTEKNEWSENDFKFFGSIVSKTCSKKCLLPYVHRQINWIVVSIYSASYLSAFILMRSVFELMINLLTSKEGEVGTREKINNILILEDGAKKEIKKTWGLLCSWTHPYKKWLTSMCPIYIAHRPLYHSEHFRSSVVFLEKIIDLYLIVCKENFKMDIAAFQKEVEKYSIDLSNYPSFVEMTKLNYPKFLPEEN